jgi:CO dehydrogenase maturation factor
LLGQLESGGRVVVADFEAGLGTLTRMETGDVDVLLVIAEPSAKAIEVARRAVELIVSKNLGRSFLIANRFRDVDLPLLGEGFGGLQALLIPDDDALRSADATGVAPFDAAPDSPGIRALSNFAKSLV